MSFSFPTSPSTNDLYSFGNKTWKYNGTGWVLVTNLDVAQTAWDKANLANVQANTGTVLAQGAFDNSNTKFSSTGGSITGNVSIAGNLAVSGNISYTGNVTTVRITGNSGQFFGNTVTGFNALYAGIPAGYVTDPQTIFQLSSNYDGYTSIAFENINHGTQSSADLFLYPDNGNANDSFLDLGIGSSTYNYPGYGVIMPNDGYLLVSGNTNTGGGNLILNSAQNDIMFVAGGTDHDSVVMRVQASNNVIIIPTNASTSKSSGALIVNGGVGVGGNVYASAIYSEEFRYINGTSITDNANAAFDYANSAYNTANNALANTTGTFSGDLTISGNLVVTGANVALGNVGNVHIYGGNTGQILVTDNQGNLSFIDLPTTNTTTYVANTISLTNGVYISGSVSDIQTLNDGNYYAISDGSNTGPAWIITTTFTNVVAFNRLVTNIDYTANSGHIIYFQIYNNITMTWDNLGSYSGASGYSQYALEVLQYTPYISSGTVQVRLYHSNTGNPAHVSHLDYLALQLSAQGAQGPRGATGAQGSVGAGVASGGTVGQVLIKNSSTNYDTSWSNNLINAYNGANSAGSYANSAYTQANTATNDAAGASLYANGAFIQANAAYAAANNVAPQIEPAFAKANAAYESQNTTGTYANSAYAQANTATSNAAGASLYANGAFIQANAAYAAANNVAPQIEPAFAKANAAYQSQNTTGTYANSAYAQANTATNDAAGASLYANGAFIQANAAFGVANNALPKAGGTITGDLGISGNLTVAGGFTYVNTATFQTTDSLIELASNNSSDVVDIGFYGQVNSTTFTGLVKQASSNNYLLFKGLTNSPSGNVITNGAATAQNVATLIANVAGYSITSNGVDLYLYTTNAYTQANTGVTNAATADSKAVTAGSYANSAYTQANTATTNAATADNKAVTAGSYANSAYTQANTATNNAAGASLYANGAFIQANAAFSVANNALPKAGGIITGTVSSNSPIIASSFTANTGVTIGTVGFDTSNTLTTSTTAQVSIDSFTTTTYRSARYFVQATSGSSYHIIELFLVHDGTTVYLSQYGEVFTGSSLGTFDASITTGTLNVLFTPTNAITTVKLIRRSIVV